MADKKYETIKIEKGGRDYLGDPQPSRQAQRHEPAAASGHGRRAGRARDRSRRPKSWCSPAPAKRSAPARTSGSISAAPNRIRRRAPRRAAPPTSGAGRSSRPSRSRPSPWSTASASAARFTQVSACDFAIAADDATFGLSEVNWGILPGGIVSWNVVQMHELARRHVLCDDRRHVRRQEGQGDRLRQQVGAEGEAARRDHQARQEADGEEPGRRCATPRKRIRAVRFMNEPQAARLSQRQERRAQVQRQGKQPPARHEAVPGRQVLPPRPRPLQAPEGGGEVASTLRTDAGELSLRVTVRRDPERLF